MKKFRRQFLTTVSILVIVGSIFSILSLMSCKKEPVLTLTKDSFRVKYEDGHVSRYYIVRPTNYVYEYEDESVTLSNAKAIFDNDLKQYDNDEDTEVISFDKTDDYYEIKWKTETESTTEQYSDIYDTSLEDFLKDKDSNYYFVDKKGAVRVWETAREKMHKDIIIDGLKYNCRLLGYYDLRVTFSKYDREKDEQWIYFYQSLNFAGDDGNMEGWWRDEDGDLVEIRYETETRRATDDDDVDLMYEDYNSRIGEMSFIKGYENQIKELLGAKFNKDKFLVISYRCWIYDKDPAPENMPSEASQTVPQVLDKKKLRSIYEKTVKYWQYDEDAYFFKYSASDRLKSGRGICWDYALYFYNECKKAGIKNVHFIVSNKLKHAWNEVWDDGAVYIIDPTFGDTDPYANIDKYFMVDAALDKEHYESDICVVDDTMLDNDISSLYRGVVIQDTKRQRYTSARPIVKLGK
jgi:hypothetical protein